MKQMMKAQVSLLLLALCLLERCNVSLCSKIITESLMDAGNVDMNDEETSALLLEATSPHGPSEFNSTASDSSASILQPVASESASQSTDATAGTDPSALADSDTPIVLAMASESISRDHSDTINAKESSKWNVHKPLPKQTAESKNKYTDEAGCHEEQAMLVECKRRLNRGKMKKDASSPASDSPAASARDPAAPASAIRKYTCLFLQNLSTFPLLPFSSHLRFLLFLFRPGIADAAASLTMFGRNSSQDCFQCGNPCSKFCCYAGQSCCLYKAQCSCCY